MPRLRKSSSVPSTASAPDRDPALVGDAAPCAPARCSVSASTTRARRRCRDGCRSRTGRRRPAFVAVVRTGGPRPRASTRRRGQRERVARARVQRDARARRGRSARPRRSSAPSGRGRGSRSAARARRARAGAFWPSNSYEPSWIRFGHGIRAGRGRSCTSRPPRSRRARRSRRAEYSRSPPPTSTTTARWSPSTSSICSPEGCVASCTLEVRRRTRLRSFIPIGRCARRSRFLALSSHEPARVDRRRSRPDPVRHDLALPLPVRAADARAGAARRDHADALAPDRGRGLAAADALLRDAAPDQLRDRRRDGARAGVRVRDELVGLLEVRRQRLRRAAGDRGARGVHARVDVPRALDLRLEPALAARSTWRRSGSPSLGTLALGATSSSSRTRGCSTRSATRS